MGCEKVKGELRLRQMAVQRRRLTKRLFNVWQRGIRQGMVFPLGVGYSLAGFAGQDGVSARQQVLTNPDGIIFHPA